MIPKPVQRWWWAFILVLVSPIVLLYGGTTVLALWNGGFKYREYYSASSPDQSYRLLITGRCAFPANDVVDPSTVLRFQIFEIAKNKPLAAQTHYLVEAGDYQDPLVEWSPSLVRIMAFDSRNPDQQVQISLTSRSTRTQPWVAASSFGHSDISSPLNSRLTVGPVNFVR